MLLFLPLNPILISYNIFLIDKASWEFLRNLIAQKKHFVSCFEWSNYFSSENIESLHVAFQLLLDYLCLLYYLFMINFDVDLFQMYAFVKNVHYFHFGFFITSSYYYYYEWPTGCDCICNVCSVWFWMWLPMVRVNLKLNCYLDTSKKKKSCINDTQRKKKKNFFKKTFSEFWKVDWFPVITLSPAITPLFPKQFEWPVMMMIRWPEPESGCRCG